MHYLIGFLIALAVGLTGVGGGSFTVPALVLLVGLTGRRGSRDGFSVCRRAAFDWQLLSIFSASKFTRAICGSC